MLHLGNGIEGEINKKYHFRNGGQKDNVDGGDRNK